MNPQKKSPQAEPTMRHIGKIPITSAADIQWYGSTISQTKVFGEINPAEGALIVMICHQHGWSLMEFADTFNFMHGRLSKKTDAISADFEKRGGVKEIITRSPDCAEVKLMLGKTSYTSKVTWEDCMKEPFAYSGRQDNILAALKSGDTSRLSVKDKYATPRSRMQMLWARALSDGVRVVCPECVQGLYTPEEVDDFDDVPQQVAVAAPSPAPSPSPVSSAMPTAAEGGASSPEVCPAGNPAWVGKRWDDESVFSLDILKQALNVQHPSFTPEMKTYIASVIARREAAAPSAPAPIPSSDSEIPPMPQ